MLKSLAAAVGAAALLACLPAAAQAQPMAKDLVVEALVKQGITGYQIHNQIDWQTYLHPVSGDGFNGLNISIVGASGGGVALHMATLRNTTSKPYCIVPILTYSLPSRVKGMANTAQIVEPYSYTVLFSADGWSRGSDARFGWGIAYWPARTDVSEGRCWSAAPEGLDEWRSNGRAVDFWNNRR
jgi:hypothetical protein